MSRTTRLLVLAFVESFAIICVERGIYFFTENDLGFGKAANLWLALTLGVPYVLGALTSHAVAGRLGERRALTAVLLAQAAVHAGLALRPTAPAVFAANALLGWLAGSKWPIIESYVHAGLTPARTPRATGRFNVAWASAVPASLLVSGPVIAAAGSGFFLLPAALNLACLAMTASLEPRPLHLDTDHPERPDAARLERLRGICAAGRWLLLSSYCALWVLAALLPAVLRGHGFAVGAATGLSGILDLGRVSTFLALQTWTGWHERGWPLAAAGLALPAAFFCVLFGGDVSVVVAGEFIFGVSAGVIYTIALYTAMVVKNAAVEAGGAHEGLIGAGFAVGPLAGLFGLWLGPRIGGEIPGTVAGIGPLFLLCGAVAAAGLHRLRRARKRGTP